MDRFPIPVNEQVVIKADPFDERTEGGIIVSLKTSAPSTGMVYATSVDCYVMKNTHNELAPKDRVLFMKNAGISFDYEGEEFLIMEAKHILAVI